MYYLSPYTTFVLLVASWYPPPVTLVNIYFFAKKKKKKPDLNCIVPTSKTGPTETVPSFINRVACFEP